MATGIGKPILILNCPKHVCRWRCSTKGGRGASRESLETIQLVSSPSRLALRPASSVTNLTDVITPKLREKLENKTPGRRRSYNPLGFLSPTKYRGVARHTKLYSPKGPFSPFQIYSLLDDDERINETSDEATSIWI